ncbi:MAG TPA: hypothetical protein PKE69_12855, partial [Pyrinomonadaceae bacterium]|nr:hypothetical protein [Pyrinomonadaceae bacterium]
MTTEIAFHSITELIVRKSPMQETLQAIVSQTLKQEEFALARIWLIDKGDICDSCVMRPECPNQELCLHLTASVGKSRAGEKVWTDADGNFKRFPIGVRKIGYVAESGKSVYLDNLQTTKNAWIVREDWIKAEKIEGFAAHP